MFSCCLLFNHFLLIFRVNDLECLENLAESPVHWVEGVKVKLVSDILNLNILNSLLLLLLSLLSSLSLDRFLRPLLRTVLPLLLLLLLPPSFNLGSFSFLLLFLLLVIVVIIHFLHTQGLLHLWWSLWWLHRGLDCFLRWRTSRMSLRWVELEVEPSRGWVEHLVKVRFHQKILMEASLAVVPELVEEQFLAVQLL